MGLSIAFVLIYCEYKDSIFFAGLKHTIVFESVVLFGSMVFQYRPWMHFYDYPVLLSPPGALMQILQVGKCI